MPPRPAVQMDPTSRGVYRFKCTACESTRCVRVTVKRPDGSGYETEFISCYWCSVMYHHAGPTPVFDPGSVVPTFHSHYPTNDRLPLSDEELGRIKEAAERANRSKGKRIR